MEVKIMPNFLKYLLIGIVTILVFPLIMKVVGFVIGTAFSLLGFAISLLFYILIGWVVYKIYLHFAK